MPTIAICPACGQQAALPETGNRFRCPRCGDVLTRPGTNPPAPPVKRAGKRPPSPLTTATPAPFQLDVVAPRIVPSSPPVKKSFLDRLVSGVSNYFDQNREERLAKHGENLYRELARQRDHFNLNGTAAALGIDSSDLSVACERVYSRIVSHAWSDGALSNEERRSFDWAARKLEITNTRASQLNWECAQGVFERLLGQALEDGYVSAAESAALTEVASGIGSTIPSLMRGYFRERGEQILRAVFAGIIQDGRIVGEEWKRLLETTARLGFSQQELVGAVEPQARMFVEHVLADAKSDGVLSPDEDAYLTWLLQQLVVDPNFQAYAAEEVSALRLLTGISQGRLPTISERIPVELRAGEIPHFFGGAQYWTIRQLRSGPRIDRSIGSLTVTDARIIFSSSDRSFTLNHRNIVELNWLTEGIEVRSTSKGGGTYNFGGQNHLAFAILRTAVGRANQTIVDPGSGMPSRHISRDIRQRVWQKYAGRCAECGSNQYLEFDHIIPVAKGGSNAEANVQLLCRGCNLKKLDHI